jgi:hypothetical protein
MAVAMVVATLLNGAYGYLGRMGFLDHARFQQIVATHCFDRLQAGTPLAMSCRCIPIRPSIDYSVAPWPDYLFQAPGYLIAFKLAKEFVFAGLLLWSATALRDWRLGEGPLREAWPVFLFVLLLLVGFVRTLASGNALSAALGSRPFEFVALALTTAWLSPHFATVSRPLAWLLWLEAILVLPEMLFGLPMRSCPNSFRAAGTLVLPNSLGIVVAILLAFAAAFRPRTARSPWTWGAAAWLVIASGSGAGIVLLFVLACWLVIQRVPSERRPLASGSALLLALGLLVCLPALTQRPQLYDSLLGADGRADKAMTVLRNSRPSAAFFGTGIGPGSNLAANLVHGGASPRGGAEASRVFYADSTVTMLLLPLGMLGVLSWFALLAWGFARDRRARPFYLVVAAASVVINLPEVFPANLLLGVVLAHSLVRAGAVQRKRPWA